MSTRQVVGHRAIRRGARRLAAGAALSASDRAVFLKTLDCRRGRLHYGNEDFGKDRSSGECVYIGCFRNKTDG